ncbi:MAG: sortase [Clostridia bacterium]|nr:sortase [Clostridia bacterium]
MNQILFISNYQKRIQLKMKIIFFVFIFLSFLLISFFLFLKFKSVKKNKYSQELTNSYKIATLYKNYDAKFTSNQNNNFEKRNTFVIGLIEIPKINLIYPILSNISDELLEISVCHFYGPLPNEIGNMCIAGHNYSDNRIFGKLYLMELEDTINIYDINGNKLEYIIYSKSEVEPNDLSCLNQTTNGIKEITLITCNTLDNKRHVIKAKENR